MRQKHGQNLLIVDIVLLLEDMCKNNISWKCLWIGFLHASFENIDLIEVKCQLILISENITQHQVFFHVVIITVFILHQGLHNARQLSCVYGLITLG